VKKLLLCLLRYTGRIFSDRIVRTALAASIVSLVFRVGELLVPNPFDPVIQAAIALYTIRQLLKG
jgi:hypothetical protein